MDKIIKINIILNISQEKAFTYFSENAKLEQWLTNKAVVEMKEGGKFELFWTPDDPDPSNNSTLGCRVLAVNYPYFFNIEWKGNINHKPFMNDIRPLTNITVMFHLLGESKTQVTLLHSGWRDGDDWEGARQYFVNAWSGALKRLEGIVNKKM